MLPIRSEKKGAGERVGEGGRGDRKINLSIFVSQILGAFETIKKECEYWTELSIQEPQEKRFEHDPQYISRM